MREIDVGLIESAVAKLFIEANYILPDDVKKALDDAYNAENSDVSKNVLHIIKKNYQKSENMVYPMCQDTGMAVIFLEVGQDVRFTGGFVKEALHKGVKKAYQEGYLRKSVVSDPLQRNNTGDNLPPIIHIDIVEGDRVTITAAPKGFGSENQSGLKMLVPADGREGIIDFIVDGVTKTGGKGCSPCVIGVGIGGDFELSALLAKKALMLPLDQPNPLSYYADMEREILERINKSDVGSMGLGGTITCLGVKILTYATHIAGLPVAYNYCCHACRHKSVTL